MSYKLLLQAIIDLMQICILGSNNSISIYPVIKLLINDYLCLSGGLANHP